MLETPIKELFFQTALRTLEEQDDVPVLRDPRIQQIVLSMAPLSSNPLVYRCYEAAITREIDQAASVLVPGYSQKLLVEDLSPSDKEILAKVIVSAAGFYL